MVDDQMLRSVPAALLHDELRAAQVATRSRRRLRATGVVFLEATVVCKVDDLESASVRRWLRALQARGRDVKVTIELVR